MLSDVKLQYLTLTKYCRGQSILYPRQSLSSFCRRTVSSTAVNVIGSVKTIRWLELVDRWLHGALQSWRSRRRQLLTTWMVWYGIVIVDLYSAIITKVSNALNTLVSGEKPDFQTLSDS